MDAITPARAFTWSWIACAAVGGVLSVIGLVSVNEYAVFGGVILAAIWGPVVAIVASLITWAVQATVQRFVTR